MVKAGWMCSSDPGWMNVVKLPRFSQTGNHKRQESHFVGLGWAVLVLFFSFRGCAAVHLCGSKYQIKEVEASWAAWYRAGPRWFYLVFRIWFGVLKSCQEKSDLIQVVDLWLVFQNNIILL